MCGRTRKKTANDVASGSSDTLARAAASVARLTVQPSLRRNGAIRADAGRTLRYSSRTPAVGKRRASSTLSRAMMKNGPRVTTPAKSPIHHGMMIDDPRSEGTMEVTTRLWVPPIAASRAAIGATTRKAITVRGVGRAGSGPAGRTAATAAR